MLLGTGRVAAIILLAVIALLTTLSTPATAGIAFDPTPRLLGGALAWCDSLGKCWPECGTWVYPVGDSLNFDRNDAAVPRFQVTRGVLAGGRKQRGHDGADLSNRRAGDGVRAAAAGIVAYTDSSSATDYGVHVVVAHRLDDGDLVLTVYAHLEPGSLQVRPGDHVTPGQSIGHVGRSGRASSPHLHFEVRRVPTPTDNWLKARSVDPIAFVASRLPNVRALEPVKPSSGKVFAIADSAATDSTSTRATAATP